MWTYDKKLQYPVNIKQTNARLAKAIITQYGGANCVRYENGYSTTRKAILCGAFTDGKIVKNGYLILKIWGIIPNHVRNLKFT